MNKVIAAIAFMIMFNNYIACMKRAADNDIEQQLLKLQLVSLLAPVSEKFLPIDLLGKICIECFKEEKSTNSSIRITSSPMLVEKQIRKFCSIDKELCRYLCCPNNIRAIVNNVYYGSYYSRRGLLVRQMTIPAVQNYLEKTLLLHTKIHSLSKNEIRELVAAGADVNYCHFDYGYGGSIEIPLLVAGVDMNPYSRDRLARIFPPLLFKTQDDYDKSELLCQLGANPTQRFLNLNGVFSDQRIVPSRIDEIFRWEYMISALDYAQHQNNVKLLELLSKYLLS